MAVVIGGKAAGATGKGGKLGADIDRLIEVAALRPRPAAELTTATGQPTTTGPEPGPVVLRHYGLVIEGMSGKIQIDAEALTILPAATGGTLLTFIRTDASEGASAQFTIGPGKSYGLIYE